MQIRHRQRTQYFNMHACIDIMHFNLPSSVVRSRRVHVLFEPQPAPLVAQTITSYSVLGFRLVIFESMQLKVH